METGGACRCGVHAKLSYAIQLQSAISVIRPATRRRYDVGFLGYPTVTTTVDASGQHVRMPQRLDWMTEFATSVDTVSFWGGLIVDGEWKVAIKHRLAALSPVIYARRRIGFHRYFGTLSQCRVILTPGGNARWTYRHYEASYAGGTLVSVDLTGTRMLVPLLTDNIVMVPDHAPAMPAIERALAVDEIERRDRAADSIRHLEQFYDRSSFSRRKPMAFERFIGEVERSAVASRAAG